jgi:polyisoprenoid-binding protein YceI
VTDNDDASTARATDSHGEGASDVDGERSPRRWLKWVVIGGVATVVLFFAAIFVYANFINDSPDALDESDLSNALVGTTTEVGSATTEAPGTTAAPTDDTTPAADTSPTTEAPGSDAGFDGDWIPTTASEFGYRVEEVLAGVNTTAVGRSNEIEGLLTIEGTSATVVDITVLVENITSDDSRRDGQFRGRIMNAAEFPTAEFRITEPIDFGRIPEGDEQIAATATGELTLRGVTNPVTFDVTAQTTDGRIGVLGSIPVLFEDYGIENPSFGVVATEDNGLVEFVLVFERA